MRTLCFYHADCIDGWTSAWIVQKALDNVVLLPSTYTDLPGQVGAGQDVILVDFRYPLDTMKDLCTQARSVLVLDHHKTAQEMLEPWITSAKPQNIDAVFDQQRCGAMIAWEWFEACGLLEERSKPRLLDYVQDYDLWQHKQPFTHEVHAVLEFYPPTIKDWDHLAQRAISEIACEGMPILRNHQRQCARLLENAYTTTIDGWTVPVVNAPRQYRNELAHEMAKEQPFAAVYYDGKTHRHYSLRADKNNPEAPDLAQIAARYGGGGHRHAAAFDIPLEELE